MLLYYSSTSPYARKVRVVLLEKGVDFQGIDVRASHRKATEHNPLGKVPTLVLDDGTALFDSTVITEAVDALLPEPQLIPSEPRERALVRRWEALGDGLCDVLIPVILDARKPEAKQDPEECARLEAKVRAVVAFFDQAVSGREFLHRDAFTLADVAMVASLGYVRFRRPDLLAGHVELLRYLDFHSERPSIAQTAPPNVPVGG